MTRPRAAISASLSARGWPQMWATEAEAADLSGVGAEVFRRKVATWESRGFPKINPENGRRSIPDILAFWGLLSKHPLTPTTSTKRSEDGNDELQPGKWGASARSPAIRPGIKATAPG